jgi:cyclopropane fatty-acyl-phospholipid synthase-like methyltransferase
MAATPQRFVLAKEKIAVRKNDHILEIGCGTGILIHEIVKELVSGEIVGLDKSKSAIEKASKKNRTQIDDKKVRLISGELKNLKYSRKKFNKIVSFNVNIFLKNSVKEFRIMKEILNANGEIFVFYQFPFEIDVTAANAIADNFAKNSFKVIHKELLPASPASIIYVKAIAGY